MSGKLEDIGYELTKLWKHLTRQELCEQFGISDRSLYRYQSALGLDTKMQNPIKAGKPLSVFINTKDNQIVKKTFKGWQHFVVWSKAQSHPYRIISPETISMDYSRKIDEAKTFYQKMKGN